MAGISNVAGSSNGGIDWPGRDQREAESMKRATYEDVVNAPEHKVAEILDGELILSPRPRPRHALAASRIGRILGPYDDDPAGPGGWWILDEPELHFEEEVVVPDLAGWQRNRLPAIPAEPYFTLAPDWVCEVLSPATARLDRTRKLPLYARVGIVHAWLVDPREQTLEVRFLKDGQWTIVGVCSDSDVVRIKPFEAIEIQLGRLWEHGAKASAPDVG